MTCWLKNAVWRLGSSGEVMTRPADSCRELKNHALWSPPPFRENSARMQMTALAVIRGTLPNSWADFQAWWTRTPRPGTLNDSWPSGDGTNMWPGDPGRSPLPPQSSNSGKSRGGHKIGMSHARWEKGDPVATLKEKQEEEGGALHFSTLTISRHTLGWQDHKPQRTRRVYFISSRYQQH